MKSIQSKNSAAANHNHSPFFQKESGNSSFVKNEKPFFNASPIQAKLTVNQPNDPYEKEADAMARKVVQRLNNKSFPNSENNQAAFFRKSGNPIQRQCAACRKKEKVQKKEQGDENDLEKSSLQRKPIFESDAQPPEDENIQRKCAACEKEDKLQKKPESSLQTASPHIEKSLNSSKGSGSPLPHNTREEMESSFGADFSGVRIHYDTSSVQMNKDLNAQAFTHGSDIYFNTGGYDANGKNGQHLLAHELTHVVQQGGVQSGVNKQHISNTDIKIQGNFLGDAWDAITDTASDIGEGIVEGVSAVGSAVSDAVSSALDTATNFLGGAAEWVVDGLSSLGEATLNWLSRAGAHVWNAIEWFGSKAWDGITWLGEWGWEKLSLLGSNAWSFISNLPVRFWRIVVHGWEGITGALDWIWSGISGAAGHVWNALTGVFNWIGNGLSGALEWLSNGLANGYNWALDFVNDPSLDKLWQALTSTLSWAWDGLSGFAHWGWDGIKGAAIWIWEGAKGFGKWIWDGLVSGLEWAGRLILYVLDIVGFWEALQILWGLIFRMRRLTAAEISASLEVHPPGLIQYDLVRVDEGSIIARISGYFSGGGYRAVTTAHILHVAPGEAIETMVHELTHVAQYERVGSVYMAEAIHAQMVGEGYQYMNADGTFKHQHFWEFNREQQASICEDFYKQHHGLGGAATISTLQPLIDEMRSGRF